MLYHDAADRKEVASYLKRRACKYQAASVREYWVVDPMAGQVEAYAMDAQDQYERLEAQAGRIASRVLLGFYLKPEWLWQEELPDPLGVLAEFDAAYRVLN